MKKFPTIGATHARILLPALLVLTFLASGEVRAQEKPDLEAKSGFRIKVTVDLANLDVSVTDVRGNFLRDLKRENFRVFDDGVERAITHFAPVEAPAQVLILVETGPAVYLIHRQHLQAAYALLDGLAADDWVALAAYDQAPRILLNFTREKRALYSTLLDLRYNLGTTQLNFFGSLSEALDWLTPITGKKSIVLLTTGLDTMASGQRVALLEKLRSSEAVIFPVALGGSLREFRRDKAAPEDEGAALSFERANKDLEEIAASTGGRAFFPKEAADFERIYRELSAALRHQYSIGFAPSSRDAGFHRVEVRVVDAQGRVLAPAETKKGKAGYRISARPGYVAPGP